MFALMPALKITIDQCLFPSSATSNPILQKTLRVVDGVFMAVTISNVNLNFFDDFGG